MKLTIKVECYNCEQPIEVSFDTLRNYAEYGWCDCKEGVVVYWQAGVFSIVRLPEEP